MAPDVEQLLGAVLAELDKVHTESLRLNGHPCS